MPGPDRRRKPSRGGNLVPSPDVRLQSPHLQRAPGIVSTLPTPQWRFPLIRVLCNLHAFRGLRMPEVCSTSSAFGSSSSRIMVSVLYPSRNKLFANWNRSLQGCLWGSRQKDRPDPTSRYSASRVSPVGAPTPSFLVFTKKSGWRFWHQPQLPPVSVRNLATMSACKDLILRDLRAGRQAPVPRAGGKLSLLPQILRGIFSPHFVVIRKANLGCHPGCPGLPALQASASSTELAHACCSGHTLESPLSF